MSFDLINAGRGAGKTHALIEWVKQQDNRYVVGLYKDTGDMFEDAGLGSKFVHCTDAKEFFDGKAGLEIAFDAFQHVLPQMLYDEFGVDVYTNDVTISATMLDVTSSFLPHYGVRILSEELFGFDYLDRLKKMFTKEDQ